MNGTPAGTESYHNPQSHLPVGQPPQSDFLAEIYPTNGMANWLNAEEEQLESYLPSSRVEQPHTQKYPKGSYGFKGTDSYPPSPPSPDTQKSSSLVGPLTTPNSCYARPVSDVGGQIFDASDPCSSACSSRTLATPSSYCSPPFSANANTLHHPTAPFAAALTFEDAYRYYDAPAGDFRRINQCGHNCNHHHQLPAHVVHRGYFAADGNVGDGIPPHYHYVPDPHRPMNHHEDMHYSMGLKPPYPYPSNAKVIRPAKRVYTKSTYDPQQVLACTHEGCGKTFSMPHLLRNHLIWHSDARPYQCPHCKASFKRNCDMNRHIKSTHIHVSRRFVCHDCQMTWNRVDRYNSHMRTVHLVKIGAKTREAKKQPQGEQQEQEQQGDDQDQRHEEQQQFKTEEDESLLERFETEIKSDFAS